MRANNGRPRTRRVAIRADQATLPGRGLTAITAHGGTSGPKRNLRTCPATLSLGPPYSQGDQAALVSHYDKYDKQSTVTGVELGPNGSSRFSCTPGFACAAAGVAPASLGQRGDQAYPQPGGAGWPAPGCG